MKPWHHGIYYTHCVDLFNADLATRTAHVVEGIDILPA